MKRKLLTAAVVAIAVVTLISYKYYHRGNASGMDAILVKASAVKEVSLPKEIKAIATITARSVQITPKLRAC